MSADPYKQAVRAAFENPVHAGDLSGTYSVSESAQASSSADGPRVKLSAGIDDGKIAEARFRAWGCPHLIAAAEIVCVRLENEDVDALTEISANELMAELSVPVTKLGRLLLLEDVAGALRDRIGKA